MTNHTEMTIQEIIDRMSELLCEPTIEANREYNTLQLELRSR